VEIDVDTHHVTRKGEEVRLTKTEWGLLEALSEYPGKLLTHGGCWSADGGRATLRISTCSGSLSVSSGGRSNRIRDGRRSSPPTRGSDTGGYGGRPSRRPCQSSPVAPEDGIALATGRSCPGQVRDNGCGIRGARGFLRRLTRRRRQP
jgi:hypothetical protein